MKYMVDILERLQSLGLKDLKENNKGVISVQRLKEKTSQESKCLVHIRRGITLKKCILLNILIKVEYLIDIIY